MSSGLLQMFVKLGNLHRTSKKARGHISQNIVGITIKMKTIVQKPLMIYVYIYIYFFFLYSFFLYKSIIFNLTVNFFFSFCSIHLLDYFSTVLNKSWYFSFLEKLKSLKSTEFIRDIHIPSVIVFSSGIDFHEHPLYKSGKIILQDKVGYYHIF